MARGSRAEAGGRIALLPEHVQNQIAAGEVIERPASIVKELVENALDAGARRVQVDLEEGGVRLVRVSDDGEGMPRADLELAFVPHATSKLAAAADLEHIASLGFRGEALASMGAVARCRIVSRERGRAAAFAIEDEGGRIGPAAPAGGAEGTTVEVRDLFFNTPARRRFLKRTPTELARCLDVVQRLALAHAGMGFVVTHDGRRLYDVEPSMDLAARVRRTFGAELAASLVEVRATDGALQLAGYVAPPRFARADAARQMWFVNARPLRDRLLARCLKDAYKGVLFEGRQPAAFLALALDPAQVDVNVHPAKAEVRFREPQRVFGFCLAALKAAVRRSDMAAPGAALVERAARRGAPAPHAGQRGFADAPAASRASEPYLVREVAGVRALAGAPQGPVPGPQQALPQGVEWAARDPFAGPFLRLQDTYIARATEDGLEIVDQHALHERVTYEALLADARAGRIEVQHLLVPELVELAPEDAALIEEQRERARRAGFELAPFGPATVALSALPARLAHADPEALVRGLAQALRRSGEDPDAEALLGEVLHTTACRASVMAGDRLADAEVRALLERAAALAHDQTCPHGRPTRVRFTRADLEQAFLRR